MASSNPHPRLALPAAPPNSYGQALSAAMEAISLAVNAKLQDRDDHFRFQEVGRLAKIGEAIGRQRARADLGVEGYVSPERRAQFACNVPDGGGIGRNYYQGFGHNVGGLGGVDPLDEIDPPIIGGVGPRGQYGGAILANPGVPAGDDGNPMGMFREVFDRIQAMNEEKNDSRARIDSLEELRKLKKLLAGTDLDDDERKILEDLLVKVTEELKEAVEPDAPEQADAEEPQAADIIRCLDPQCGNAHDADWITAAGNPRRCDVCNGPMMFAPARTAHMGADLAAAAGVAAGYAVGDAEADAEQPDNPEPEPLPEAL